MLKIQTLGELDVKLDNTSLFLPPSKKTRALLAYLILNRRPHRRDRLCELFWDIPDDPKGALRWSLSKLRKIVNDDKNNRLVADRERVEFIASEVEIDIRSIDTELEQPNLSLDKLNLFATQLSEPLLEGIDLPRLNVFQNWLISERENKNRLYSITVKRLSKHQDITPKEALYWAKIWLETDPFNSDAAKHLVKLLRQLDKESEATALLKTLTEKYKKAEIDWPLSPTNTTEKSDTKQLLKRQKIQFCETSDKVKIAYATVGQGLPLVKAANWLSHLELDWDAPIWSPLFRELAQDHYFIRYDERGNGLSDWNVADISQAAFVKDLETLVDSLGLEKFPLLGISQGAAVSIDYAVKHPGRVSHLILFGAYAAGWRIDTTPEIIKEREAVMTLTETGWGQDNPAYRQIFSSTFMPSASPEDLNWFNEFQRQTTSPQNAARFQSAFGDIDVRDKLSQVTVPTLVIHSSGDRRIPVSSGREIAASIPNAEFLCLESDNHLLIGQEPAAPEFVKAVKDFIKQ